MCPNTHSAWSKKGKLLWGRRCVHTCTCLHKLLIFDIFSKKHIGALVIEFILFLLLLYFKNDFSTYAISVFFIKFSPKQSSVPSNCSYLIRCEILKDRASLVP